MNEWNHQVKVRGYDNRGREEQARRTRRRILDAAAELLLERGYAATTFGEVAARAGVSVDTIYKGVGGKAALAKAVYDVTLAGDDEPVPMAERPEFQAMAAEADPRRKIECYVALARSIGERLGPLLGVLLGARGADPDLEAFSRTIDAERLAGSTGFIGHLAAAGGLRPGLEPDWARDLLWALNSPELRELLVDRRGWSAEEHERWLADTLIAALL